MLDELITEKRRLFPKFDMQDPRRMVRLGRHGLQGYRATRLQGYKAIGPMAVQHDFRIIGPMAVQHGYRAIGPMAVQDGYRAIGPMAVRHGYRAIGPMAALVATLAALFPSSYWLP